MIFSRKLVLSLWLLWSTAGQPPAIVDPATTTTSADTIIECPEQFPPSICSGSTSSGGGSPRGGGRFLYRDFADIAQYHCYSPSLAWRRLVFDETSHICQGDCAAIALSIPLRSSLGRDHDPLDNDDDNNGCHRHLCRRIRDVIHATCSEEEPSAMDAYDVAYTVSYTAPRPARRMLIRHRHLQQQQQEQWQWQWLWLLRRLMISPAVADDADRTSRRAVSTVGCPPGDTTTTTTTPTTSSSFFAIGLGVCAGLMTTSVLLWLYVLYAHLARRKRLLRRAIRMLQQDLAVEPTVVMNDDDDDESAEWSRPAGGPPMSALVPPEVYTTAVDRAAAPPPRMVLFLRGGPRAVSTVVAAVGDGPHRSSNNERFQSIGMATGTVEKTIAAADDDDADGPVSTRAQPNSPSVVIHGMPSPSTTAIHE
jgi:hypothetical protein